MLNNNFPQLVENKASWNDFLTARRQHGSGIKNKHILVETMQRVEKQQRIVLPQLPLKFIQTKIIEDDSHEVVMKDLYETVYYSQAPANETTASMYVTVLNTCKQITHVNPFGMVVIMMNLLKQKPQNKCVIDAIINSNILKFIVNIFQAGYYLTQLGALKLMIHFCAVNRINRSLLSLGITKSIIEKLHVSYGHDIRCLAACLLCHLAPFGLTRTDLVNYGGIQSLVLMCVSYKQSKPTINLDSRRSLTQKDQVGTMKWRKNQMIIAATVAMAATCKSELSRRLLQMSGVISILFHNLRSTNTQIICCSLKLLLGCSDDHFYRVSIRSEGFLDEIIKLLAKHYQSNADMVKLGCLLLGNCVNKDAESRDVVRNCGGLQILMKLYEYYKKSVIVLTAIARAFYHLCESLENVKVLNESQLESKLLSTISDGLEEANNYYRHNIVLSKKLKDIDLLYERNTNLVGCLSVMSFYTPSRKEIVAKGGLTIFTKMLNSSQGELTVNLMRCIGNCSQDADLHNSTEALRILFSLLSSDDPRIQRHAAKSLFNSLYGNPSTIELMRSFVGSMEMLLTLLRHDNVQVLTEVTKLIAVIATNQENLAIFTDMGIAYNFDRLLNSTYPDLLAAVGEAIEVTSKNVINIEKYREIGVIQKLADILKNCNNKNVLFYIVKAINALTIDHEMRLELQKLCIEKRIISLLMSRDSNEEFKSALCDQINKFRQLKYEQDNGGLKSERSIETMKLSTNANDKNKQGSQLNNNKGHNLPEIQTT